MHEKVYIPCWWSALKINKEKPLNVKCCKHILHRSSGQPYDRLFFFLCLQIVVWWSTLRRIEQDSDTNKVPAFYSSFDNKILFYNHLKSLNCQWCWWGVSIIDQAVGRIRYFHTAVGHLHFSHLIIEDDFDDLLGTLWPPLYIIHTCTNSQVTQFIPIFNKWSWHTYILLEMLIFVRNVGYFVMNM